MNIKDKVKKWLFTVAAKKVVKRLAQLGAAYAANAGLAAYGFTGGEQEITAAIYAAFEFVRNFVKTKWPEKFGWL